jgi:hypothetical protein
LAENSYRRQIVVSADPGAVYRALAREMDRWWAPGATPAQTVGDTVVIAFGRTHWHLRATHLVPGKRVELACVAAHHVEAGHPDSIREEWLGTTLCWSIEPEGAGSRVTFTHQGLVPALGCYGVCEAGWDHYFLDSLRRYLDTGVGEPG